MSESERARRDPLEGVRGIGGNLTRLRVIRAAQDPEHGMEDIRRDFVLGVAAERLMSGTGEIDDFKAVFSEIVIKCETRVRECMAALIENPDLKSDEAKTAHFEGRVAGGILRMFNEMIEQGREAALKIHNEGESE